MTDADSLDLATIEREAYIKGDTTVAQLCAVAEDRTAELETLQDEFERLSDSRDMMVQDAKSAIDRLHNLITEGKRVSGREDMLASLRELEKIIDF